IFLAVVVCSTVVNAEMTKVERPATTFIRSGNTADGDKNNTERGINLDAIPVLTKLTVNIPIVDKTRLQLWLWLTFRTSADDVFKKMKLTSVEGNLLADSTFLFWLKYVDDLNQKNPREAKSAVSVLASRYGDNQLSTMLNAAMKEQHTKALAIVLQTQRLEDWKLRNIPPLDVFEALQFKKHDILMNPALTSWFKYLDDFNVRNPTEKLPLMKTLSLGLGNRALAEVLEAGVNAGRTKEISTKLKNQLFAEWETKKFSPDIIFGAVGLKHIHDATRPILSDPVLNFWVRYLNEFNQKHPREKTTLIDTLRKNYADEALIEMLVAAKKDPTTETIAKNLELLLLTRWLREKKQPPTVARWMFADKSDEMLDKYTRFFKAKWPSDA
ncbi:hypothetical protein PI126_g24269, partial [Phytophthora idaei]